MAQAKTCSIPINQVEVSGVKLLQSFGSFKQTHPTAKAEKEDIFMPDTDYAFARHGVMYVGSIDFDSSRNRIIAYTLNYTEGKYADYETPLDTFKSRILKISNIPKTGWVLSKDKGYYLYTCDDYKIHIRQDHGAGRGAIGAVVWVFSRYSDGFTYY